MNGVAEIGDHLAWLGTVAIEPGELRQRAAGIALQHRLEQIEDAHPVGKTKQPAHRVGLDLARAEGDSAIEDRQRIAHRAFRRAGDQREAP